MTNDNDILYLDLRSFPLWAILPYEAEKILKQQFEKEAYMSMLKCRFCGWKTPNFKKNKKTGKMVYQYYKLVNHVTEHEKEYEKIQEFCSQFFLEEEE